MEELQKKKKVFKKVKNLVKKVNVLNQNDLLLLRLIVLADEKVVQKRFPAPLLNRLEKHFLVTDSMLTDDEKEIKKTLDEWVKGFGTISMAYMGKR